MIVRILKDIDLQHLLLNVGQTCKRLNEIIQNNSVLWKFVEFDCPINGNEDTLCYIFRHSFKFLKFQIPCANLVCDVPHIDLHFINGFSRCQSLQWLDVSECRLSTLCFLKYTPNLEILNVSSCMNLKDDDFAALKHCTKLEKLYLSFTEVTAETIVKLCEQIQLTVLDICGIRFSLENCHSLLALQYSSLLHCHLSLQNTVSTQEFQTQVQDQYFFCRFRIHT